MQNFSGPKSAMPSSLAMSIFGDRSSQFIDRLKWDLCVTPDGCEVDEYDDENSIYLTVHDRCEHLGSCRVRHCSSSTMLVDHFLDSFPEAETFMKMQRGRVYELTRFCRNPDITVDQSRLMLGQLACMLDRFREDTQITGYVAVVFPQVARFLDTIGVRYLLVSKSTIGENAAYLICITHAKNNKLLSLLTTSSKTPSKLSLAA